MWNRHTDGQKNRRKHRQGHYYIDSTYLTQLRIQQIPPSQTQKSATQEGPQTSLSSVAIESDITQSKKKEKKTREIMKGCRSLKML